MISCTIMIRVLITLEFWTLLTTSTKHLLLILMLITSVVISTLLWIQQKGQTITIMAWQFMNLHAARLINKINTLTSTEVTKINSNRVVYIAQRLKQF